MFNRDESKRGRGVAVAGAFAATVLLTLGGAWHVADLRATRRDAVDRRMTAAADHAAKQVDAWIAERADDASALVEIAGIRGSDSAQLSPRIVGRILRLEMEATRHHGNYAAVWLVDRGGKVLGSAGQQTLSALEDSAVQRSLETRHSQVSRPERRDGTITVGVSTPVIVTDNGRHTAEAAVVFRANLNSVFTRNALAMVGPTLTTPVLVIPVDGSLMSIMPCPPPSATVCLATGDTLAKVAQAPGQGIRDVTAANGRSVILATRHIGALPWSVYDAIDASSIFATMRDRLRFEALFLTGLLLMGGLGLYAHEQSGNLRRLTERAQTDARFSAIVNTAMDAIIIVNARYEIAVMNSAAEIMFGYSAYDTIRRSVLELVPAASTEELHRALVQTLRAGEQPRLFSAERYAAGRRSDGSMFPIDLSVSRTQLDGQVHLAIVIRDITVWKHAEESSEWQRRVLEAIATGTDLRDVLTTIVRFHETQTTGVDCAIHLIDDDGVMLNIASAPSMHPAFIEAMDEIVIGPHAATCGTAVYRREQVVTPDIATDRLWNEYRALASEQGYRSCWALPIRSPQGRMLGAIAMYTREEHTPTAMELRVSAAATQLAGVAVDRAHAAESLRQSEASFRSFVENSPIGIYRATGSGRLLAVNASLVELLGYSSALELLQLDMGRDLFVSVADRERLAQELKAQGELRSAEAEWRRKDGATVTVRVSARAYRDERGSVWFTEGFVENVTPLRVIEHALRQSEKLAALGQLLSGVAHELNNPLAAILHFTEDLLDDERTSADVEALGMIRDQARRSRTIVRDLLSFARARDASRTRVQLTEALAASAKALQPAVEALGARLAIDLPLNAVYGNTDRAGLQQIVTNLVMNAAQASGPGGIVRLRGSISDQEMSIVVEDSGPGIPPTLQNRIFEPFFTTKPVGEGTGLGLSVTLGIVQQLGGHIAVENRQPGDGTGACFTVTLPIDGDMADAGNEAMRTPSLLKPNDVAGPRPRALIIDDEPSIRAALRRFFCRRGWDVEEATNGAQGLSSLLSAELQFAVVISDLRMPGCTGVELHDRVASVAPEILNRIIFSTGDVASTEVAEFVQRTQCTVLEKPFELRALENIVTHIRKASSV